MIAGPKAAAPLASPNASPALVAASADSLWLAALAAVIGANPICELVTLPLAVMLSESSAASMVPPVTLMPSMPISVP